MAFCATVLATDDPHYSVVDWSFLTRVLANEVSCYSVGDWRFVASVLATNVSCYSVGDCNFIPGMSRKLLSGGCRVVVPQGERDRPQLVTQW